MREKLIELMLFAKEKGMMDKQADFLIANGVTIPVYCKDCRHFCRDLSGRENHLCMRKEASYVLKRKVDDFCSYGERKEGG